MSKFRIKHPYCDKYLSWGTSRKCFGLLHYWFQKLPKEKGFDAAIFETSEEAEKAKKEGIKYSKELITELYYRRERTEQEDKGAFTDEINKTKHLVKMLVKSEIVEVSNG